MAKVVYEELVQAMTLTGKMSAAMTQNINQANVCLLGLRKAPLSGEAATAAQEHYTSIYNTLFMEIEDIGHEISEISMVLPQKFNECVPDSHGFEANTALLLPLLEWAKARKQYYEEYRDYFNRIADSSPLENVTGFSYYCYDMASYYQQLADQMQEMIEKLTEVIDAVAGFEAACSGLYDNVMSRLALIEHMYKATQKSGKSIGFDPSPEILAKTKEIREALKKRKKEARREKKLDKRFVRDANRAGVDILSNITDEMRAERYDFEDWDNIKMIGDEATEWIEIDREQMRFGANLVDIEPYFKYKENSCAWFASMVLVECGGLEMVGNWLKGDNEDSWYCNISNETGEYLDGSNNFINANGMCSYFSKQPYTSTYQITGTIEEQSTALKAMQDAGVYKDGDLLFFDKKGDGEQNHVVILNGKYDRNLANGADCNSGSEQYDGEPAFYGQNDNHHDFSVKENLETHSGYSDNTVLTVVAFNG